LPPHEWQAGNLWRRAVALYGGDLLPEVGRVWCVPKREALHEMYLEALIGVGRCYEARKEFDEAIGWYRRALEVEELREDVHRRIMHCYAEAGRRSEALAQYSRCQEVLKRELGIEPMLETKRLYQRIAGKGPD
jgi:LuxR family maltose regulon positive regulatory protein